MDESAATAGGGWLLLAMIAILVAQSKNRSGLNWFFLTLFFGPLAFIILLLSDTVKKASGSR
ncbi:MAG: antitermination protein NusB [Candidatus Komeilibacteria bacterium]